MLSREPWRESWRVFGREHIGCSVGIKFDS